MLGAALLLGAIYLASELGLDALSDAIDLLINEGEIAVSDPIDVAIQLALIGVIFWPAAIAATLVHQRSVSSLIAPLHRFRWSFVGKVLSLQIILLIVGTVATLPWLDGIRFTRPGLGFVIWLILPYFVISELFIIHLVMRTGGMEAALVTHWWNNFFIFVVLAESATQANDLTLFVFDEDPSTSVDEAWGVGGAIIGIGLQYLGFTWRRSPFYLDRHGWTPPELPPPPPPNAVPNMTPPPPPGFNPPIV